MLIYFVAHEHHKARRYWTLERRIRRAVRDFLRGYSDTATVPTGLEFRLTTGERFMVTLHRGRLLGYERVKSDGGG